MNDRRLAYAFGFLILMTFDTLTQISFKLAGAHAFPPEANLAWLLRLVAEPWAYAAVAGYVGAFATWMKLLEHAPIGPAFAASHLEVVSVMLLSVWLFDERVGSVQISGALMIVAGIVCLALGERKAAPEHA